MRDFSEMDLLRLLGRHDEDQALQHARQKDRQNVPELFEIGLAVLQNNGRHMADL